MQIFAMLGWLALLVPLCWLSIACYFATVVTFGEALFSSNHWYVRAFGIFLWIALGCLWLLWLSCIKVDLTFG